jgi:hypothetical protein
VRSPELRDLPACKLYMFGGLHASPNMTIFLVSSGPQIFVGRGWSFGVAKWGAGRGVVHARGGVLARQFHANAATTTPRAYVLQ